jgi:molybdopterin/thiamine biosynthesis adenylyltransferase
LDHVAIRYQRRGEHGVLIASLSGLGSPKLAALNAAPDDQRTRDLRAHPHAAALTSKSVAIVGVGAIGSVVADLLHRHGVGRLVLVDGDVLKPGNTTRHLLGNEYVGLNKAIGMERMLSQRLRDRSTVTAIDAAVTALDPAVNLLDTVDVVVDATADGRATALLTAAADAGAGRLVSACVLADGYAVRVDVTPHPDASVIKPPDLPPIKAGVHETGCSSPVSTTPPAAAVEAAAIAARVTTELLLDHLPARTTVQRIISAGDVDE